MDFGLSEEQTALQDTVRKFLNDKLPTTKVREVMGGESGHDPAIWAGLAELGVLGLLVPEAHDGIDLAMLDAALVAEVLGMAAAPTPYVECAVMAVVALREAGTDAQQAEWLPKIAMGEAIVTLAASSPNGRPAEESLTLDGDTLNGNILFVPAAQVADALIVPIAADGGTTLYLIPRSTAGLGVTQLLTIDKTRRICEVTFEGVRVTDDMVMGAKGGGAAALARTCDAGRIALVADGVGTAQRSIDMTLEYAKTREQFNRPIGGFQAVKHMCADMVTAAEPIRAYMWYAAHAFDTAPDEVPVHAALAKALMGDVGMFVAKTATECHGGIGFTEECDMQLYYKRASLNKHLLGSPEANRELAAQAQGFA